MKQKCTNCLKECSKSNLKKVWLSQLEAGLLCNDCRWARIQRIKNGEKIYVGKLPRQPFKYERKNSLRIK